MADLTDVDRPAHYDGDACMIAIEDLWAGAGFCIGNMIKYAWRAGKKDSAATAKDLHKAKWYFDRALDKQHLHPQSTSDRASVRKFLELVAQRRDDFVADEAVRQVCDVLCDMGNSWLGEVPK